MDSVDARVGSDEAETIIAFEQFVERWLRSVLQFDLAYFL